MPWWAWLVLWGSLVLTLLAVLAVGAWRLIRKGLVLLDDVAALADRTLAFDPVEATLPRPTLAVLAELKQVRDRENRRREHRARRRDDRRQRRLDRARRIISVDASTRQWPANWYRPSSASSARSRVD